MLCYSAEIRENPCKIEFTDKSKSNSNSQCSKLKIGIEGTVFTKMRKLI